MFRNVLTLVSVLAAAVVAAAALTSTVGPRPAKAVGTTGDAALAARLSEALGGRTGVGAATVARLENGHVTYAGLGTADEHTPFEIGSVTKALNGLLLADMADRGDVALDEAAGDLVPGLGATTLTDLATHHSGLPRLPRDPAIVTRSLVSAFLATNPYAGSTATRVLDWTRDAAPPGGRDYAYSNLGAAALGQALAVRAGEPYPVLLRDRVLDPLGMGETTIAASAADVPAGHAVGTTAGGRRQAAWIGAGFAPAGIGVWSTSADLGRMVAAVMADDAPGSAATTPRADAGEHGRRVGLGWFTSEIDGRSVTWHNGGTGGFHTFVGYDAASGRGVAVLAATSTDVDTAALTLLLDGSEK